MHGEARRRSTATVTGLTLVVLLALAGGLAFGPGASGQVAALRRLHRLRRLHGRAVSDPDPNSDSDSDDAADRGADGGSDRVAAPPRDTRACRVSVRAPRQNLGAVRRSGLRLRLTTDEQCRLAVRATVDRSTARRLGLGRRSVAIAQLTRTLPAGSRTVALKLTRKAARAVRRARSLRLTISITTRDAAGNSGRLTERTTVRR